MAPDENVVFALYICSSRRKSPRRGVHGYMYTYAPADLCSSQRLSPRNPIPSLLCNGWSDDYEHALGLPTGPATQDPTGTDTPDCRISSYCTARLSALVAAVARTVARKDSTAMARTVRRVFLCWLPQ